MWWHGANYIDDVTLRGGADAPEEEFWNSWEFCGECEISHANVQRAYDLLVKSACCGRVALEEMGISTWRDAVSRGKVDNFACWGMDEDGNPSNEVSELSWRLYDYLTAAYHDRALLVPVQRMRPREHSVDEKDKDKDKDKDKAVAEVQP